MEDIVSGFQQYSTVTGQIKKKLSERKKLLTEKKALSPLQFSENRRLNAKIAEATEDLEELKSEKEQIMSTFGKYDDKDMKDVKSWIDRREEQIQKAEATEAKYSAELDKALDEYHALEARAEALAPEELKTARLSLRPKEENRAVSKIEEAYGNSYDYTTMCEAKDRVSVLLGEDPIDSTPHSVRRDLQQAQETVNQREQLRPRQTAQNKHVKEHDRLISSNKTCVSQHQINVVISVNFLFIGIKGSDYSDFRTGLGICAAGTPMRASWYSG